MVCGVPPLTNELFLPLFKNVFYTSRLRGAGFVLLRVVRRSYVCVLVHVTLFQKPKAPKVLFSELSNLGHVLAG